MPKSIPYLKVLLKDQLNELQILVRLSLLEKKEILSENISSISDLILKKRRHIKSIRLRASEIVALLKQLKPALSNPDNIHDRIHANECRSLFKKLQKSALTLSDINRQNMTHIKRHAKQYSSQVNELLHEEREQEHQEKDIDFDSFFQNPN